VFLCQDENAELVGTRPSVILPFSLSKLKANLLRRRSAAVHGDLLTVGLGAFLNYRCIAELLQCCEDCSVHLRLFDVFLVQNLIYYCDWFTTNNLTYLTNFTDCSYHV